MDILKKLKNTQGKYESSVGSIERPLIDVIQFRFSLLYQNSDGWVIVDDEGNNSPLDIALKSIEEKGFFTYSDYLDNLI